MVLLLDYGSIIVEVMLISSITDTKQMRSAIIVVEDNGEDCVGHHSKKDGKRQDPGL